MCVLCDLQLYQLSLSGSKLLSLEKWQHFLERALSKGRNDRELDTVINTPSQLAGNKEAIPASSVRRATFVGSAPAIRRLRTHDLFAYFSRHPRSCRDFSSAWPGESEAASGVS